MRNPRSKKVQVRSAVRIESTLRALMTSDGEIARRRAAAQDQKLGEPVSQPCYGKSVPPVDEHVFNSEYSMGRRI